MGHTAEYCSVSQASGADESAPRNFKEEINKGNKLKAAIEAAIRLRPRICERTSQDPSSVSVKAKNMISVEGTHESQTNLQNQTSIGNMKLLNAYCTDALSVVSSVGNAPPLVAESAVSEMSAIPEHECIWQGAFQVHKMGKPPDFCGGIQAHLSTLASPKVIEVVNTFPLEVPLNEVPCLSTWPTQFHNSGPKEDNIALYFFAKDLESYEKYYKVLLDTMVKNDLALKGNFKGVEFLIFPSNKLPESCQRKACYKTEIFKHRLLPCNFPFGLAKFFDQIIVRVLSYVISWCFKHRILMMGKRKKKWLLVVTFSLAHFPCFIGGWNTLSFLWGVFKGRRANCSDSSKSVCIPDASMVHLEREKSTDVPQPVENESAACDSSCNVVVTSAVEKTCISTVRVSDSKVSSFGKTYVGIKAKLEEQDGNIDNKYLSRIATNSIKVHPDMKSTSPLDDGKVPDCRLDTELKPCHQATETNIRSFEVKKEEMQMPVEEDYPSLKDRPTGKQEAVIVGKIDGESVKIRESWDDGYADVNTYSKRDVSSWQLNHRKRPYLDLTEAVAEMSTESSQRMPWSEVRRVSIDRGSDNKKLKMGFTGIYKYNGARDEGTFSDSTSSERHGLGSGSCVKERRCNIACEEKGVPKDMGSGERFFPMGSDRAREIRMDWREELLVKDEDRAGDASPNLELALGAEMRPPNKGILPFFVGTADKSENLVKVTGKEEADDVSASLSLSLSFPFPKTEGNAKSVSKTEQLLPESHGVNTSLLLFGGFPNK
ncbi:Zinc finger, PHD-type [Gossypium australe]|uniref:Zinc finger, PHD-type n=1 Tax=Gossypium australe TaxID=47621 RepID=A0A5B6UGR1_9ROSI|nr:Zinc finger, PHD-type [Gossypium australe]